MKKNKLRLDQKLFIGKGIIATLTAQEKIVGGAATVWTVTGCSTPQVACATAGNCTMTTLPPVC